MTTNATHTTTTVHGNAGWFEVPGDSGPVLRYYDGTQWTEHTSPVRTIQDEPAASRSAGARLARRPKRALVIVGAAIAVLLVGGLLIRHTGSSDANTSPGASPASGAAFCPAAAKVHGWAFKKGMAPMGKSQWKSVSNEAALLVGLAPDEIRGDLETLASISQHVDAGDFSSGDADNAAVVANRVVTYVTEQCGGPGTKSISPAPGKSPADAGFSRN